MIGPSVNDVVYGYFQLEHQFDSRSLGARKKLANYAQSGCSTAAGTQGSGVSGRAVRGVWVRKRGRHAEDVQRRCDLVSPAYCHISTTLLGDETDSHARFLEVVVNDIRIANIYAPNGNPVGSDKFLYKLAWMDRLQQQMQTWLKSEMPTLVGGDFNVIPEDIDCHKPASWMHDALFQPEPRIRYRALIRLGYTDAFRSLHPGQGGHFTFWDYFRKAFEYNRGIRIDHFLLSPGLAKRLESCEIDKGPRALDKPSDHTPIVARFHGV